MTTDQALAWADARMVARWATVREANSDPASATLVTYDLLQDEAMTTLAEAVRAIPAREREAALFGYHWQRDGMGYGGADETEVIAALARWREPRI